MLELVDCGRLPRDTSVPWDCLGIYSEFIVVLAVNHRRTVNVSHMPF